MRLVIICPGSITQNFLNLTALIVYFGTWRYIPILIRTVHLKIHSAILYTLYNMAYF